MNNTVPRDNDQGSFLTGFGLGLFAGAAGYFLFATDKGKKIQDELAKEWQEAKKNLEKNQSAEKTKATLKELLIETASSFLEISLDKSSSSDTPKKSVKRTKTKATKSSSSNPKKFKGV